MGFLVGTESAELASSWLTLIFRAVFLGDNGLGILRGTKVRSTYRIVHERLVVCQQTSYRKRGESLFPQPLRRLVQGLALVRSETGQSVIVQFFENRLQAPGQDAAFVEASD